MTQPMRIDLNRVVKQIELYQLLSIQKSIFIDHYRYNFLSGNLELLSIRIQAESKTIHLYRKYQ